MKKLIQYSRGILFVAALIIINGCASSKITVDEAYRNLKPVKQLELPDQVEDNLVIVLENVAERYAVSVWERDAVRPGVAVVFGQEDAPVCIAEGLVVALRVNVRSLGLQAIPEVVR